MSGFSIKNLSPDAWSFVYTGSLLLAVFVSRTFANYIQNFVQRPALKVNSICRGNYGGSSMWILTQ